MVKRLLSTNPRSGTHYLKALISTALGEPPVERTYADAGELEVALSAISDAQLIYGHFEFSQFGPALDPRKRPDLRLVVLTRHPLDRLISQLAYARAKGTISSCPNLTSPPQQLARELLLGEWDGKPWADGEVTEDYAAYHNFRLRELVTNWLEFRTCHLVKFEELIADPFSILTACLDFLEVSASPNDVRSVIEKVSFTSLSNGRNPGQLDPTSHYRNGIPGEWRKVFSAEDIRLLEPKYGTAFRQAGYDLWGTSVERAA